VSVAVSAGLASARLDRACKQAARYRIADCFEFTHQNPRAAIVGGLHCSC